MANASATLVTIASTVMTVGGSVSGTIAVGQTIVGAGVPGGVHITSFGTGTGTQGTYNISQAVTVSTAEPMSFWLFQQLSTVGNAVMPQLVDVALAAGFGLIVGSASMRGSAGPGAEYHFGLHQKALYDSYAGGQVFSPLRKAPANILGTWIPTQAQYPEPIQPQVLQAQPSTSEDQNPKTTLRTIFAGPQNVDLTQQAWLPSVIFVPQGSAAPGAEYNFGLHAKAIHDSYAQGQVFPTVRTPPVAGGQVPLRSFHTYPQEIFQDVLTLQGSFSQPLVVSGWCFTMVTAGPQIADLNLQASFSRPQPKVPTQAPRGFSTVPQDDPIQRQPLFVQAAIGATQQIKPLGSHFYSASPTPWDPTVNQGLIYRGLAPSAKYVQPAVVQSYEQQYDRTVFPTLIIPTSPLFVPPPPVPAPTAPLPQVSEWTTDATAVTADTINYTADGTNLIAAGGLPTDPTPPESSGSGNPGPARNVSQNLRF